LEFADPHSLVNDPAKVGFIIVTTNLFIIFFNFLNHLKMNKVLKFSIVALVVTASLAIYSCAKDTQTSKDVIQESELAQNRTTGLCEGAAGGCTGGYTTEIYTISEGTPTYPNCEFNITLRVRRCGNNVDVIYVGFGSGSPIDPDCNQFEIDTDNPLIAAQVIEQVEKDLIKAGTIRAVLNGSNQSILPWCGVNPAVNVSLFQSACSKACLVKVKKPKEGESGFKVVIIPCGESCCKSVNEICIDPLTGDIKIKEISKVTPASPCTISSNIPCPPGTVFSTGCRPTCASIGQGG
jgi:hypothetical protein